MLVGWYVRKKKKPTNIIDIVLSEIKDERKVFLSNNFATTLANKYRNAMLPANISKINNTIQTTLTLLKSNLTKNIVRKNMTIDSNQITYALSSLKASLEDRSDFFELLISLLRICNN